MYSKSDRLDLTGQLFDRMLQKDLWSWTAMISGFAAYGFNKSDSQSSSFNHTDFCSIIGRSSNFGSSDVFGEPRPSNYEEHGAIPIARTKAKVNNPGPNPCIFSSVDAPAKPVVNAGLGRRMEITKIYICMFGVQVRRLFLMCSGTIRSSTLFMLQMLKTLESLSLLGKEKR